MSDDQQEPQREVMQLQNGDGEARPYEPVASRLARFRFKFPDHALLSEIIKDDGDSIAIKAQIGFYLPTGAFVLLAEGHSETFRDDPSVINRAATMEVTETSAWGRALAAFGFASPVSLATADEVEKAQRREKSMTDQAAREPGCLVLLQNAAKKGLKELERVWKQELQNADRKACSKYMPNLKVTAEKNDGAAKGKARRTDAPRDGGDGSERDSVD